jgi:hypothetical protein
VTDRIRLDHKALRRAFRDPEAPSGWFAFTASPFKTWVPPDREALILTRGNQKYWVPVTWRDWAHGGKRVYYRCLGCGRSVLTLFLGRSGFRCRTCERLGYLSEGGDWQRLLVKAAKARARVGPYQSLSDPFPEMRPKGRWRKRHRRLVKEAEAAMRPIIYLTLSYHATQMDRVPSIRPSLRALETKEASSVPAKTPWW